MPSGWGVSFGRAMAFFLINKVYAIGFHFLYEFVIDFRINNSGLLGSADHTVIEGFRHDDIMSGLFDIGTFFDISRHITRPHA